MILYSIKSNREVVSFISQMKVDEKDPAIKKLTWGMKCYGLIPKGTPSDEGVPLGAGSEFSVEKVPGGFEVT